MNTLLRFVSRVVRQRAPMLALALVAAFSTVRTAGAQSTVTLLGYTTTVPAAWTPRPPASSMRLAEYVTAGDSLSRTEIVVYFFGKSQGGNVAANLARWKAQFSTPDGSPVPERITRDSTGAFPITIAEYRGTYARGIGAGSPENARANQGLIAAIAETPRGTMFIQLFGPDTRVAGQRDALLAFVKGLKD